MNGVDSSKDPHSTNLLCDKMKPKRCLWCREAQYDTGKSIITRGRA